VDLAAATTAVAESGFITDRAFVHQYCPVGLK